MSSKVITNSIFEIHLPISLGLTYILVINQVKLCAFASSLSYIPANIKQKFNKMLNKKPNLN